MWTESDAKRGSNEIATYLLKFMTLMKDSGIKEFSFYSDNWGSQNRNRFIYSMWEYASATLKVTIVHRFLEVGHTQNEGDSMHATIECAKKGKVIYVPSQWVTLDRCAKLNKNSYLVFEMSNEDFLNFKPMVENADLNWKKSTNNEIVKWNNIREISTSFEMPFTLKIKYDYSNTDYVIMDMILKKKTREISSTDPFPSKSI